VLRDNLAAIRRAVLLAFSAGLLALLPGSQLARVRGTVSQLLAGWGAYIFEIFEAAATGATYGLFVGWIIGLATMSGRAAGR
jgi:hypothetical protein